MTNPADKQENPHLVQAVYQALVHSNVPSVPVAERRMGEGRRWQLSISERPLTATEGTLYLYVENLTSESNAFVFEPPVIYADGRTIVTTYKNADVDTSTFNSVTITNLKSDTTTTPDANVFEGLSGNVTVTSTGTLVSETIVGAGGAGVGNRQLGTGRGRPILQLEPGDNVLIELTNDAGADVNLTVDTRFYEEIPDSPGFGT